MTGPVIVLYFCIVIMLACISTGALLVEVGKKNMEERGENTIKFGLH